MRTPGQGEELAAGMTREGFAAMLAAVSRMDDAAIDACWKALRRRRAPRRAPRALPLGRLREARPPYEGRLAALGVPALLVWGADDPMAPVKGARILRDEMPGSRLVVLEDEGHFIFDDAPALTAGLVAGFLDEVAGQAAASGGSSARLTGRAAARTGPRRSRSRRGRRRRRAR